MYAEARKARIMSKLISALCAAAGAEFPQSHGCDYTDMDTGGPGSSPRRGHCNGSQQKVVSGLDGQASRQSRSGHIPHPASVLSVGNVTTGCCPLPY